MEAITLLPGKLVSLSVEGRTLSIINDPLLAVQPPFSADFPFQLGDSTQKEIDAGTVLVGLGQSPTFGDAAVPPFCSATIPIPHGVGTVQLLYPGPRQGDVVIPALIARTAFRSATPLPQPIVVSVGWSDAEGPLAVLPTGGILPRRLLTDTDKIPKLPVGVNWEVIPPSPATPVYDQGILLWKRGPFFRPHLAPSGVAAGEWSPAAAFTLYPALLSVTRGPDPFCPGEPPGALPFARLLVIHKVIVSAYHGAWPGTAMFLVIGTAQLMAGGFTHTLARILCPTNGVYTVDFGEGIAANWDCDGQYQYYTDTAGALFEITVIYG